MQYVLCMNEINRYTHNKGSRYREEEWVERWDRGVRTIERCGEKEESSRKVDRATDSYRDM